MSIAPNERRVPQFNLAHRLGLARQVAGMKRKEMAEVLDVTPQSISNYELGNSTPSKLQLNAWAVATGVDVEWLKTGEAQPETPRGGPETGTLDYNPVVSLPRDSFAPPVRRAA